MRSLHVALDLNQEETVYRLANLGKPPGSRSQAPGGSREKASITGSTSGGSRRKREVEGERRPRLCSGGRP